MVLNYLLGLLPQKVGAHPQSVDNNDEMDTTPAISSTVTRNLLDLNTITHPDILKQLLQQCLAFIPTQPSTYTQKSPSLTDLAPPVLVAMCQLIETLISGKIDYAEGSPLAVLQVLTSMPDLVKTLWAILSRSRYV